MARQEQDREDLLREATAYVERIELKTSGSDLPVFIGHRAILSVGRAVAAPEIHPSAQAGGAEIIGEAVERRGGRVGLQCGNRTRGRQVRRCGLKRCGKRQRQIESQHLVQDRRGRQAFHGAHERGGQDWV